MKHIEMKVKGMTCAGCSGAVKRGLQRLAGVKEANADATSGKVSVSYDETQVNEKSIADTIRKIGYTPQ